MKIRLIISALAMILFVSCAKKEETKEEETSEYVVEYEGRKVDLQPFFEGFPYSNFQAYYKTGKIFYYKAGDITSLNYTDLNNPDFENGTQVTDIDYSLRNVWSNKYNPNDNSIYWMGDEVNDEKIDLFRLNLETNKVEKLTDVPYIFGWNFNKDKNQIAYIVRLGELEDREGELRIMSLENGTSSTIIKDSPEYRFTWANPSVSPNNNYIIASVLKNTDRTKANLMLIDVDKGKGNIITDTKKGRFFPDILSTWIDNGSKVLYTSDEDGYKNVYSYDIYKGKTMQVTKFTEDVANAEIATIEGKDYLVVNTSNPIESTLYLVDPISGDIVTNKKYPFTMEFKDIEEGKLLAQLNGATTMFRIEEITLSPTGFTESTKADLPKELKDKIINADVEKVEFPTFDIDPATGKQRMIHAFLYKPKDSLPKDKQRVLIQSFYGGSNTYNVREQILTNAGMYVLSPSPRGSSGFGKDFFALNDKDLGGNEILDIIFAAKYISEKLDIPAERVGVHGGSHGGYAVMRLLTFPGEVNGHKDDFSFGFGIAHAGFSDIIHFYEHCNIPDWVTLEAGDPATEKEKLNSRSPLYNAYDMEGRLLLTHGINDSRVPIEGSRFMADSLRKYKKDVTLQEYEGMGHHIKGLENSVRQYKTWFDFIQDDGNTEEKK
ncbi:MAG: S9 family peptidase [Ignavibacteriae bacterium]|nr:S9 family peptidase [Ignavibacteriota bacterium]MCB9221626.1 S9 family peptidase [Ignavibacteria bacterium]